MKYLSLSVTLFSLAFNYSMDWSEATVGRCGGAKARKTSTAMMATGMKRSVSGGGGSGGRSSGRRSRETVRSSISATALTLKYLMYINEPFNWIDSVSSIV